MHETCLIIIHDPGMRPGPLVLVLIKISFCWHGKSPFMVVHILSVRSVSFDEFSTYCPFSSWFIPSTHHSNDGNRDDKGDGEVGHVRLCVDVRVSDLVDLQHAQPSDHVHKGRVCKTTTVMS